MSDKIERQRERRALRRQLGLCWHCLEPAERGGASCKEHKVRNVYANRRRREKQQAQRGWRLQRVKV